MTILTIYSLFTCYIFTIFLLYTYYTASGRAARVPGRAEAGQRQLLPVRAAGYTP